MNGIEGDDLFATDEVVYSSKIVSPQSLSIAPQSQKMKKSIIIDTSFTDAVALARVLLENGYSIYITKQEHTWIIEI